VSEMLWCPVTDSRTLAGAHAEQRPEISKQGGSTFNAGLQLGMTIRSAREVCQ
jgi:hypothetical protein